jgi:pimeloyl-ACP methyl ester carboxylesterase
MRLHAQEWGRPGRPGIALLHGVGNSSSTWWRVAPALAAGAWRVVALDLRGHGNSGPDGLFTAADLGADVVATLAALELPRPAVLWGHSLGAIAALAALNLSPGLADRIVLEDPPGSSVPTLFGEVATDVEEGCAAARQDPAQAVADTLAENPLWTLQDAERAVESRRRCDVATVVPSLRRGLDFDLLPLLAGLEAESCLLLSREEESPLVGPERRQVANSCDEVVAFDSGHSIHVDRFERCLATVSRWIAPVSRLSAPAPGPESATPRP